MDLAAILNGPHGVLFMIIAAVLVLIAFGIIVLLILRGVKTKLFEVGGDGKKSNISSYTVRMDLRTFKNLIDACEQTLSDQVARELELHNMTNKAIITQQQSSIDKAIRTVKLDYMNDSPETDDIASTLDILELYLAKDLAKAMSRQFEMISEDKGIPEWDEDKLTNLSREITNNVVSEMIDRIIKYTMVNKPVLKRLLESKQSAIRDNVLETLKKFKTKKSESANELANQMKLLEQKLEDRIRALVYIEENNA